MTIVLDAGALIALDRDQRPMWVRLKAAKSRGDVPVTHAQGSWDRHGGGGPRQARLSQALAGIDVRALGEDLGRAAGELLGAAGQSDVIDAAVVVVAHDGDDIITSDAEDLRPLPRKRAPRRADSAVAQTLQEDSGCLVNSTQKIPSGVPPLVRAEGRPTRHINQAGVRASPKSKADHAA